MPGITVYIVKPGDTLWDIAKKFYTTVEEIISDEQSGNRGSRYLPEQPLLTGEKSRRIILEI